MLRRIKERWRKRAAEEKGMVRKDWSGKIRIALAFPNRYSVGMANLGFQSVYRYLNAYEDVVCERVFYPETEDLKYYKQNSGKLVSLESSRPVKEFDIIGFSVSFENDYPNLVEMLTFAGISPRTEHRGPEEPLVIAGGVAVFLNPEPLAAFVDLFFIGEAEELLRNFLTAYREFYRCDCRTESLKNLVKECPGIYAPSLYEVHYDSTGKVKSVEPRCNAPMPIVVRRADLDNRAVCQSSIISPDTEFGNTLLIEIGRGCGRGCRFCAAGFVYRPPRFVPAYRVISEVESRLGETSRLGLVSAAVSDHPEISEICSELMSRGAKLSFASLRADDINTSILDSLIASAQRTVAIGIDAGSERLRQTINKHLTIEQILHTVEMLTEAGILNLKLYFMIGLPTETLDDLEALVDVIKKIKHHVLKISRGKRRLGTIVASINAFVPKPFTPFQWVSFAGIQSIKESTRWIKRSLSHLPNVRVHFDVPKWAYVQALMARGDRRVAMFIEQVALNGKPWSQALREVPYNPDFWVMRERDSEEYFPWEIIDHKIDRSFLWDEYQLALKGKETPFCNPDGRCTRCGICGWFAKDKEEEIQ